ncbi:MAG: serpin family protein [Muribaculum sp.]|nr:serpin family protein [Muribaculum sp.]
MKKILLWSSIAAIMTACSSDDPNENTTYHPITLTPQQKEVVDGYKEFSYDFFREAVNDIDENENVIVSPYSMANMLSMLSNAADAETKASITALLNIPTSIDINEVNKSLYDQIMSLNDRVELSICRSLWSKENVRLNNQFKNCIINDYHAQHSIFTSPQSLLADFRDWLNKASHGMISDMNIDANESTKVLLADLMYFKGQWLSPFNKADSHPGIFHNLDGTESEVTMMENKIGLTWISTIYYDLISIPFNDNSCHFEILLPGDGYDVNDLIANLQQDLFTPSPETAEKYEFKSSSGMIPVILPRFEIDIEIKPNKVLSRMGLSNNWSGMLDDNEALHIKFIQKSAIKVDEEGATASSATSMTGDSAINFEAGEPFIVDRPFVYILRGPGDIILQMGKICKL